MANDTDFLTSSDTTETTHRQSANVAIGISPDTVRMATGGQSETACVESLGEVADSVTASDRQSLPNGCVKALQGSVHATTDAGGQVESFWNNNNNPRPDGPTEGSSGADLRVDGQIELTTLDDDSNRKIHMTTESDSHDFSQCFQTTATNEAFTMSEEAGNVCSLPCEPSAIVAEQLTASDASSIDVISSGVRDLQVSNVAKVPLCDALSPVLVSADTGVRYVVYESERQMEDIMRLITKDLSEPYSIYTYRYFIHNWPRLCFLAMHDDTCIGAIVCKLDKHKTGARRGYIAMLAVDNKYRKLGIGSNLVVLAIRSMMDGGCDEVVLETEISNGAALHLYEKLGFVRDKRLFRYYLNGVDALRLKLWLR